MAQSVNVLGSSLSTQRKRTGRTQTEIAASLGMAQAQVSRIEQGNDARVSTIQDIASALGLEIMLVPKTLSNTVRALIDAEHGKPVPAQDTPRWSLEDEG
ncbi:MAG: helix-turn-helix domain-containing protein [Janthinobacterium lividum]